MDFCAKKQEALAAGMTLILASVFGFVLLSVGAPSPDAGTALASAGSVTSVTIDGVTVSVAP